MAAHRDLRVTSGNVSPLTAAMACLACHPEPNYLNHSKSSTVNHSKSISFISFYFIYSIQIYPDSVPCTDRFWQQKLRRTLSLSLSLSLFAPAQSAQSAVMREQGDKMTVVFTDSPLSRTSTLRQILMTSLNQTLCSALLLFSVALTSRVWTSMVSALRWSSLDVTCSWQSRESIALIMSESPRLAVDHRPCHALTKCVPWKQCIERFCHHKNQILWYPLTHWILGRWLTRW